MVYAYFYTEKSMICRPYTQHVEEAADELDIKLIEVDILERKDLVEKYAVEGIPCILKIDENKVVVERLLGLQPLSKIKELFGGAPCQTESVSTVES